MNCTIAKKCGGCAYINSPYAYSLEKKNQAMQKLFAPLHLKVHPIVGMKDPYGYRNKVIVAFNKNYEYGLYEESTHRIIPYHHCLLHDEESDAIIQKIAVLLKKYHVPLYDEKRRRGDIRHVLLRRGTMSHQYLVTIVSANPVFKGSKNFCATLVKAFPHIQSIVLNINKRQTSIVLGQEEKVLYGKGFIVDRLCDMTFKISSSSFYQINHDQCEALYTKALSLLPDTIDTLYDTYCGIGTIGLIASTKAQKVIGIEKNKEAIKDAITNKKMNKIPTISFVCDDATAFMVQAAKSHEHVDAIIMDPPRSGSTPAFIKAVAKLQPQYVLYISCGPETQVRDLQLFLKLGYHFSDVYPFDLFPFTKHVETVVLMSKVKGE